MQHCSFFIIIISSTKKTKRKRQEYPEFEEKEKEKEFVRIGFVAVEISSRRVVYDEFQDTLMRDELQTRLKNIRPCEIIVMERLTIESQQIFDQYCSQSDIHVSIELYISIAT